MLCVCVLVFNVQWVTSMRGAIKRATRQCEASCCVWRVLRLFLFANACRNIDSIVVGKYRLPEKAQQRIKSGAQHIVAFQSLTRIDHAAQRSQSTTATATMTFNFARLRRRRSRRSMIRAPRLELTLRQRRRRQRFGRGIYSKDRRHRRRRRVFYYDLPRPPPSLTCTTLMRTHCRNCNDFSGDDLSFCLA